MKNNLDELLKKALVPMDVPDRQLNQQVLLAVKERKSMKNQRKVPAVAAAAIGSNPGEAVSAVMTTPASDLFKATINALGGNIRMVNAGGYKVTALAPGADGRTVASVGTVKGVTKYAFVLLISVNEDGTTEIVEGTVDPVTLQVMGAFKGTPRTITVSVVMAK